MPTKSLSQAEIASIVASQKPGYVVEQTVRAPVAKDTAPRRVQPQATAPDLPYLISKFMPGAALRHVSDSARNPPSNTTRIIQVHPANITPSSDSGWLAAGRIVDGSSSRIRGRIRRLAHPDPARGRDVAESSSGRLLRSAADLSAHLPGYRGAEGPE